MTQQQTFSLAFFIIMIGIIISQFLSFGCWQTNSICHNYRIPTKTPTKGKHETSWQRKPWTTRTKRFHYHGYLPWSYSWCFDCSRKSKRCSQPRARRNFERDSKGSSYHWRKGTDLRKNLWGRRQCEPQQLVSSWSRKVKTDAWLLSRQTKRLVRQMSLLGRPPWKRTSRTAHSLNTQP